jgi:mycothiol system anti-sigma-R factor
MSFFERLKGIFGRGANGAGAPVRPEMISCREALSVVYEFLDGELEDAAHERVKAHFDVCGRCYPHLKLEESFRAALRNAAVGASAPPELKARIGELLSRTDRP